MRIISGINKNKNIQSPNLNSTHPMGDRERIALFNMLESEIGSFKGLKVLDLYAGTGALGLEALSRGASSATFVENSEKCLKTLRSNILSLSLPPDVSSASVVKASVKTLSFSVLDSLKFSKNTDELAKTPKNLDKSPKVPQKTAESADNASDKSFDIIFADPPYGAFYPEDFLPMLNLLNPSGIFVLSSPKSFNPASIIEKPQTLPSSSTPEFLEPSIYEKIPPLVLLKSRTYANSRITLFRNDPASSKFTESMV
ncbi:RsmD family RNA methyltransferase [Candidatus Saccharibacteria bacterium]|nr:RsmD family RNA methyltransferase [Candidatus Saccharibacteria bacterium]